MYFSVLFSDLQDYVIISRNAKKKRETIKWLNDYMALLNNDENINI